MFYSLNPQKFAVLTTLCGEKMSATRVMESLPTLDKPSKRGCKTKLNHLGYYARKMGEKCVQVGSTQKL